jgi:hypothetical protein
MADAGVPDARMRDVGVHDVGVGVSVAVYVVVLVLGLALRLCGPAGAEPLSDRQDIEIRVE